MEENIKSSDEYNTHLPNMPVYEQEALKQNISLNQFLSDKIGLHDEIVEVLIANWKSNNIEKDLSGPIENDKIVPFHKNMWRRKTDKELEQEKGLSGKHLVVALFFSCFFTLGILLRSQSWGTAIFCFIICFILSCIGLSMFDDPLYFISFLFGESSSSGNSVICSKCHKTTIRSDKTKCECGGDFEPIEKWTWVENDLEN